MSRLDPNAQRPALNWHDLLALAANEHDVINVVRDFVASLDGPQLMALPSHCRPGKFFEANDVSAFAFEIVRHECSDDEGGRDLVHRMAAFFSHASIRLSELGGQTNNDPQVEQARSA